MSVISDVVKTLLLPFTLALFLYVLITQLLLPLYRRHRSRYSQYIPVPSSLSSLSERTPSFTNLRNRVTDAVITALLPSSWLRPSARIREGSVWRRESSEDGGRYSLESDELFGEEEGESMVGFSISERRREALERRRSEMDDERRLSRDLEQGFRDDSGSESDSDQVVAGRRSVSRSRS